jgi:hypothetical protein
MLLLITSEVKIFERKVALRPRAARSVSSRGRVLQQSVKILQIFWKIRTFSLIFWKLEEVFPLPPLPRARGSRLDLPPDVKVCHAKFGCSDSYRNQMHKEQTGRHSSLYIRCAYRTHWNIPIVSSDDVMRKLQWRYIAHPYGEFRIAP